MFLETLERNAQHIWFGFFMPNQRIFVLYLLSAIVLAGIAYWQLAHEHDEDGTVKRRSWRGFFAYVFDKRVLLSPSSIQDIKYFIVNAVIYYGLVTQFLLGVHGFSVAFHSGFMGAFGALEAPLLTGTTSIAIYTLASVLALDFAVYLAHLAHHKIPILWHFHKVHHSALTLTPLTLFRMHPVDLLLTGALVAVLKGVIFAGLFYLSGTAPEAYTIFGLNIILFVFYLLGYNLRHSHIWLDYPAWLSKIFISPAQHQIHHSSDPKHFDRNMGLIFSFWDQLFKTHYLPRGFEKLSFGIDGNDPNPFKSVADLYLKPFIWAYRTIEITFASKARRLAFYGTIFAAVVVYFNLYTINNGRSLEFRLPSLALQNLTWTEVKTALDKGYTRIIIPTGGTEQNGPHVILGKHNYIIEHTSVRIARQIGKTLVAPVMAYVPEGTIEPDTSGHMRFSGTLSLPQPIFEQVLEATARSLKAHGFKHLFFIGDSGGNQSAQKNVADKLNAEWRNEGVQVIHVANYYSANGQTDHLLAQGFTKPQIGTHAGIRDTSELMYVAKSRVRQHPHAAPIGQPTGANGDRELASAEIGKRMIELKVEAAVKQIRAVLADGS